MFNTDLMTNIYLFLLYCIIYETNVILWDMLSKILIYHQTQLNLGHLAPCSWEPVVISLNCLMLNMNSTKETLLFDRFLIMHDLCVFSCIIVMFVFHCTHVRMSYVLNCYLLTYLHYRSYWGQVFRVKDPTNSVIAVSTEGT